MYNKIRQLIALTVLLASSYSFALAPPAKETLSIYSQAAKIVAKRMPLVHLEKKPIDDELAAKALEIFINALDYDHTVFMESDVDKFRAASGQMDDNFKAGNLDFAFNVFNTYMQRISNRVDYVDQLLDKGFDFSTKEQYRWKRKAAPHAQNEQEWNDLWRKKIKNIYIGYKVSEKLDEADKVKDGDEHKSDVQADAEQEIDSEDQSDIEVAETAEEKIRNQYKQLLNVMNDNDADWLLTLYITSFTRALDPHSDFMSQRDIEDFNISMKKSLNGIGALLSSEDGAAKIERVIPGGPADLDGRLKPNDKIIAVSEGGEKPVDIRHWPLSRAVRLIRGEKGSKVVLSVIPASDISGTKVKKIELTRDEVKLEEQVAKGEIRATKNANGDDYNVGVITIPDFYADMDAMRNGDAEARSVTRDVSKIIEGFETTNKIDGLVIDLRNNGGGLLNEAVELTGLFIDSGPVVQVKTQSWLARKLYDADPVQLYKGPLVILVNRLSASASEIFTAALKDYNRAVIVGDSKTYGKGTVQALLPLSGSNEKLGSLKLTTAGFYRISGSSTQLIGVKPDIVIPSILDYMEIGEEYQPHVLKLDPIRAAFYWPDKELDKIIPVINTDSLKSRSENNKYQEYAKLLTHLGEQRKSDFVSLNIDQRVKTAMEENKMQDLALKLDLDGIAKSKGDDTADEDNDEYTDMVMDQTLKIISDLISISNAKNEAEPAMAKSA